jgi:hypothetical protein
MILATGLTTRGYKVGFSSRGLYYKHVMIVIYDGNDSGLFYKCVFIVIYNRNDNGLY